MNLRNRIGLNGSYFLGMAGIGFTLPFLPDYLQGEGLTKWQIGLASMLAALFSLLQFPIGIFADHSRAGKPLLVVALSILALSTWLLYGAHGVVWLGILVIFFAENGICRAMVESLSSAEAARLAPHDQVGAALGALRFWKPIGIMLVALTGGVIASEFGVGAILIPLMCLQTLAVVMSFLINDRREPLTHESYLGPSECSLRSELRPRDRTLWIFILAMVLFHTANSPGGVYLALFLKEELKGSPNMMSYAFVISMLAWMITVRPAGRWADHIGRRPLLILAWLAMTSRLALVAIAVEPWQVLAFQVLDGLASGVFSVIAGAWVMDRLADRHRACEAQVIVGTSLVFGSALGPLLSGIIIGPLGYREMFAVLAAVGMIGTLVIVFLVPETIAIKNSQSQIASGWVEPETSAAI